MDEQIIFWIICVLSIVGVILNIYKNKLCFYIWLVANVAWVIVDFYKGIYGQGVYFIVCVLTCIWGIKKWSKDDNNRGCSR